MNKKQFVVSEFADVVITDNKTGEVQYEGKAKTHNIDRDTDEVIVFTTENHAIPIGFDKEDENFKSFIEFMKGD